MPVFWARLWPFTAWCGSSAPFSFIAAINRKLSSFVALTENGLLPKRRSPFSFGIFPVSLPFLLHSANVWDEKDFVNHTPGKGEHPRQILTAGWNPG